MATFAEQFINQAMTQNEQAHDPTAGSGFAQGAQLAQHAEQLRQQRMEIQQKQQQLQMMKLDKVAGWFESASKMTDDGVKNAFTQKYIPNGITALGLQDAFHPDSLGMMQKNPLVVPYMMDKIRRGDLKLADVLQAAKQPEDMANMFASPDFAQFGAQQEIKDAVQGSISHLSDAAKFAASEEGKGFRANLVAQAASGRQDRTIGQEDARDLQTFKTHIVDTTNKTVAPLKKELTELDAMQPAIERLKAAMAAGKSDYKGAAQDAEAVKLAFLRSVVGRVTEQEREAMQTNPGIAGIMQNHMIKYGSGGFNMNTVGGLIRLVEDKKPVVAEQFDQQNQLVQDEVNNSRWSAHANEILKPVKNYVNAAKPKEKTYTLSNGKSYPASQLKAFIQQHGDDPDSAPAVAEARKALGM